MGWVTMPTWLFWVYAQMMPQLQAQESIMRINEMSFSTGHMEQRASSTYMRRLQRQAAGQNPNKREAVRPRSLEHLRALMGSSTRIILEGND
jgi:hypothetical protein